MTTTTHTRKITEVTVSGATIVVRASTKGPLW